MYKDASIEDAHTNSFSIVVIYVEEKSNGSRMINLSKVY